MTDQPDDAPATLIDAKLYKLARSEDLLQLLRPAIDVQMALEEEISESFPRDDDDGDDTRILMLFTNRKGKTLVTKLMDHERLNSQFNLSGFMAGFLVSVDHGTLPGTEVEKIDNALATTLNVALGTVLGVDDDRTANRKQEELSKAVIRSVVATVFDDPLDAVIAVREQAVEGKKDEPVRYICILTAIFKLKTRPIELGVTAFMDSENPA